MIEHSAAHVASLVCGIVHGDQAARVLRPCVVTRPVEGGLCFSTGVDKLGGIDPTEHGAVLLANVAPEAGFAGTWIEVDKPRVAFAIAATALFAADLPSGIHPSATVAETATIAHGATIGANCVIGAHCIVGDGSVIAHGVVMGPRVEVGKNVSIGSNAVLGEVGFGIVRTDDDALLRIPHVGGVIIEDNVEIGALVSIASGTIEPTRIRNGAKLDDLVFIAHNCDIGENVCVIACAEISGSVVVGSDSWIGPNATIRDGVSIAADTLIGMGAVVTKTITEPGTYAGNPAKMIAAKAAHRADTS